MMFLHIFQSFDLFFVQIFLFHSHISDFRFTSMHGSLQDVAHIAKRFSYIVVDSFENRGNITVEMIEICDYFDKTKVNKSIPATDNATVDLLFHRRRAKFI